MLHEINTSIKYKLRSILHGWQSGLIKFLSLGSVGANELRWYH